MERRVAKPRVDLLLDSGAYSAWRNGLSVNRSNYIAFIKKNKQLIGHCVNLDTLPGKPGVPRTQKDVDTAAKLSYNNQQVMKSEGLSPVPVFHQGEDFQWLRKYIADGEPYIGISPAADLPIRSTRAWMDRVFTMITDHKGLPIVKTHGFGVAAFDLLRRYPWFTCDATSWVMTAAFGSILIPVYRDGLPDYSGTPIKLTVSEKGKKDGSLGADHFRRLGPLQQEQVSKFLKQELGATVEQAALDSAEGYELRHRIVVHVYKKFEATLGERVFRHRARGFGNDHSLLAKTKIATDWEMRIVFATWALAEYQGRILTEGGVTNRLVSYWEIKDKDPGILADYIRNGKLDKPKRKSK